MLMSLGWIVVLGISGSGKTALGLHILSSYHNRILKEKKYRTIVLSSICAIESMHPEQDAVTILLLDGLFERWIYLPGVIDKDLKILKDLYDRHLNVHSDRRYLHAIFTMSSHVWNMYHGKYFRFHPLMDDRNVIDLESKDHNIGYEEALEMLERKLSSNNEDIKGTTSKLSDNTLDSRGPKSSLDDIKHSIDEETPKTLNVSFTTNGEDVANQSKGSEEIPEELAKAVIKVKQREIGVPETIELFHRIDDFRNKGIDFFQNSKEHLFDLFTKMYISDNVNIRWQYYVLSHVLFKGGKVCETSQVHDVVNPDDEAKTKEKPAHESDQIQEKSEHETSAIQVPNPLDEVNKAHVRSQAHKDDQVHGAGILYDGNQQNEATQVHEVNTLHQALHDDLKVNERLAEICGITNSTKEQIVSHFLETPFVVRKSCGIWYFQHEVVMNQLFRHFVTYKSGKFLFTNDRITKRRFFEEESDPSMLLRYVRTKKSNRENDKDLLITGNVMSLAERLSKYTPHDFDILHHVLMIDEDFKKVFVQKRKEFLNEDEIKR